MKQGGSGWLLAVLFAATTLTLGGSALSLPVQPFTGLVLQSGRVIRVMAGSPGDQAGLRRGDELFLARDVRGVAAPNPLATAAPGHGILLRREAAGGEDRVWIVPATLPAAERHMMVALLTVAAGFLLLAGLVWSERRDRLTRTFVLLCLAFSWLLAPFPRLRDSGAALCFETVYSGITLFLPALFVHFFALFPEPRASARAELGSRVSATGSRGTVRSLPAAALAAAARLPRTRERRRYRRRTRCDLVHGRTADGSRPVRTFPTCAPEQRDARRRLRVAVAGTVLGAVPLAAISLIRISPRDRTALRPPRGARDISSCPPRSPGRSRCIACSTRGSRCAWPWPPDLALAPLAATIGADALSARIDPEADRAWRVGCSPWSSRARPPPGR